MSPCYEPISGESVSMMRDVLTKECAYRNIPGDGVEALELALAIVRAYQRGVVSDRKLSVVARQWMH